MKAALPTTVTRRPTMWKLDIEAKAAMSQTNRARSSSVRNLKFDPVKFRQNLERQIQEQTKLCLANKRKSIVPLYDYIFVRLPSF